MNDVTFADIGVQITFRVAPPDANQCLQASREFRAAIADLNPVHVKVLALVMDLGNSVFSKRTARDLHAVKIKHPDAFKQVPLFKKTLLILESQHIQLLSRQFVLDLFDKSILRRIILEADLEDETDTDTG